MSKLPQKDWLKKPTRCDVCYNPSIEFLNNSVLYGRNSGDWPLIWFCRRCGASVSCHANTDIPMGFMATRETRQARSRAHKAFDKLWIKGYMDRTRAYLWLSESMGMQRKDCHISHFGVDQCEWAIALVKEKLRRLKLKPKNYTHCRGRKVSKVGARRRRT